VREGFTVEEVLVSDGRVTGVRGHDQGGTSVVERPACGRRRRRNSVVAKAVQPAQYEDRPPLTAGYYSYWSNLPTDTFEAYSRPGALGGVPHQRRPDAGHSAAGRTPSWPSTATMSRRR